MKRVAAFAFVILLTAVAANARIGGGDTYSDSSSSSSSSSSDSGSSSYSGSDYGSSSSSSSGSSEVSGVSLAIMFGFCFIIGVVSVFQQRQATEKILTFSPSRTTAAREPEPAPMSELRRFDPNFSEIVFADFCSSLFARVYDALGRGTLDDLAPYVDASVRNALRRSLPANARGIGEIVIGSFSVLGLRGIDKPVVTVSVEFEANYTAGPNRYYVREKWTLERTRDILSPVPEKARAEHCPKCGAALQVRSDGKCAYCETVINDGTFAWFVRSILRLTESVRPPLLVPSGPEPGLDRHNIVQRGLAEKRAAFTQRHPGFTWEAFEARVFEVAQKLQDAWSSREWERARPYETDALRQTHRYWIDEFLRQGIRNLVDGYTVDRVEIVKIDDDAFYDAITVRLFASGVDYYVNDAGVTLGNRSPERRQWSEYWTFVRGRAAAGQDAQRCPNCGGPRAEGQSAICAYCGGKILTGEFPWVLSRIEQDEAYRG